MPQMLLHATWLVERLQIPAKVQHANAHDVFNG